MQDDASWHASSRAAWIERVDARESAVGPVSRLSGASDCRHRPLVALRARRPDAARARAGTAGSRIPRAAPGPERVRSVGEPPDGGAQVGRHPGQLVDGGAGLGQRLRGGVGRGRDAGDVRRRSRWCPTRPPAPSGTSRWSSPSAPPPREAMVVCRSEICATIEEISSIAATAAVVSPWIASTRRAMSSVAFAVSCASSLTSFATTAKPLPASPARAASIVAFSASRFVCSAMLVITLTTLPISAEDSPSFATVAVVVSAAVTARAATSLASAAFDAISRIEAPICSAPAATVCTLRRDLLRSAGHDAGLGGGLLRRGRDLRRRRRQLLRRRRHRIRGGRRPRRGPRAGCAIAASSAAAISPTSSRRSPRWSTVRSPRPAASTTLHRRAAQRSDGRRRVRRPAMPGATRPGRPAEDRAPDVVLAAVRGGVRSARARPAGPHPRPRCRG